MWYFAWCLGIGFATLLAIVTAVWGEHLDERTKLLVAKSENKLPEK